MILVLYYYKYIQADILLPEIFKASEKSDDENLKQCVRIEINYNEIDIYQCVYWRCRCAYLKSTVYFKLY